MPKTVHNIPCFVINVNLLDRTFDIQSGFDPSKPGLLRFACNGGEDARDVALFREILGKLIEAYPHRRVSLCIRDPEDDPIIVPDAVCDGRGAAAILEAIEIEIAAKRSAPKTTPKAAAPRRAAKAAVPKAKGRRKTSKRRS